MDHVRGCIIAGMIGDAMGGPFEGQPGPLRFQEHTAWSISDDSQLTLAICESIIEVGKVSPETYRTADRTAVRSLVQSAPDHRHGPQHSEALRDLDAGVH